MPKTFISSNHWRGDKHSLDSEDEQIVELDSFENNTIRVTTQIQSQYATSQDVPVAFQQSYHNYIQPQSSVTPRVIGYGL